MTTWQPHTRTISEADSAQITALLSSEEFRAAVRESAREHGQDEAAAMADATVALREMAAVHQERAGRVWDRFGDWMSRSYDVLVDDDGLAQLRRLDREHSLIFLISHRSYLDEFILPPSLKRGELSPLFGIAGGNLDFFPFGDIARRNGIVHVRRDTTGMPMYRLALRAFIGQLVADKANMCWSIEGGRTRTGKLRPPRYGLLRYVADAVESPDAAAPLLVPVSIMYDQIPADEIARMAAEARGAAKQSENVRWLVRYAAGLKERGGRVYVDFGAPVDLRDRMNELREEAVTENLVERVALDVCHRLNAATPITPTAAICVAMLAADRALTLDEVLATVRPLAEYVHGRGWPVAGGANLTDRSTLRWALRELCRSGVLTEYQAGTETVWNVGRDKHLIAAFYRNSVLHVLLVRAVAELALRRLIDEPDGVQTLRATALRLREGLKFDFFFAPREAFLSELRLEIEIIADAPGTALDDVTSEQAELWLQKADLLVAPLVLRPFVDAYRVLAHQLAEAGDEAVTDPEPIVRQALATGHMWALRRMIASEESVSGEMYRTALKLAAHRGLLKGADLGVRRRQFADEVDEVAAAIGRLAGMGR